MSGQLPWIIFGTSGSADYLKDSSGTKRFWPVRIMLSTGHPEETPCAACGFSKLLHILRHDYPLSICQSYITVL